MLPILGGGRFAAVLPTLRASDVNSKISQLAPCYSNDLLPPSPIILKLYVLPKILYIERQYTLCMSPFLNVGQLNTPGAAPCSVYSHLKLSSHKIIKWKSGK